MVIRHNVTKIDNEKYFFGVRKPITKGYHGWIAKHLKLTTSAQGTKQTHLVLCIIVMNYPGKEKQQHNIYICLSKVNYEQ